MCLWQFIIYNNVNNIPTGVYDYIYNMKNKIFNVRY